MDMALLYSVMRIGLLLFLALILWLGYVILNEDKFLYYPNYGEFTSDPLDNVKAQNVNVEERIQSVFFHSLDGTKIHGLYIPGDKSKPTIVFAHGNAGHIGSRIGIMKLFNKHGYGFFMFDYRGYGLSEGKPQEKGLYKDFEAASRYVEKTYGVPINDQIAMGESLGTMVAVDVASRLPYKQVVLFSTFSSTMDVGDLMFKPFPIRFFVRQKFDSLSKVPGIQCPLIILQGKSDTQTPLFLAEKLYNGAKTPNKTLIVIENAGHDVFYSGTAFEQVLAAMEKYLSQDRKTVAGSRPSPG